MLLLHVVPCLLLTHIGYFSSISWNIAKHIIIINIERLIFIVTTIIICIHFYIHMPYF